MDKLARHGRLVLDNERELAFVRTIAMGFGAHRPGIVFLGGFQSDMTGTKARFLEEFARARGLAFVRFDYSGHGASSGNFESGTIGAWVEDSIAVLDRLTGGRQILVGSSMGGWLMLLAALARASRVAALVGIAAAPDFTQSLVWERLSATDQEALMAEGRLVVPSSYSESPTILTRALIEEGRRHLLLGAPIPIHCPVRLLHGMNDPDVPCRLSLELVQRLETEDCRLTLIKDGDHRLSREQDLALLAATIDEFI